MGIFLLTNIAHADDLPKIFELPPPAENHECVVTGQIPFMVPETEFFVTTAKIMAVAAVDDDLRSFCEWNRMDRALGEISDSPFSGIRKDPERQKQVVNYYRKAKMEGDRKSAVQIFLNAMASDGSDAPRLNAPWESSLLGAPELKLAGRRTHFKDLESESLQKFAPRLLKALRTFRRPKSLKAPVYDSQVDGMPEVSKAHRLAACSFLTVWNAESCSRAIGDLLPYAKKYQCGECDNDTVAFPLLKRVLKDKEITAGLEKATISLWEKIQNDNFQPGDDIFKELTGAFVETGVNPDEAKKKAIEVLGTIAIGGPNYAFRGNTLQIERFPEICARENCNPNHIFMAAIAEGLTKADALKMRKPKPSLYSIPAEHYFPCDSGKSYHFWMMAAFTQELQNKGYDAVPAQAAAYLSQLAYQMRRSNQQPEQREKLLEKPRFGTLENSTRIDLVLSAAGTRFAADIKKDGRASSVDLQKALSKMIKDGGARPNGETEASFIFGNKSQTTQWLSDIAPESAFNFVNQ